jgi:chemotaxis protein MotA
VLLAYGIFGPIATRLQGIYDDEIKFYHVIRVIITAHLHGQAPQISVETGRKGISHEYMPSFAEVEEKLNSLPPV